jgi:aprataxin
MNLKPKPSSTRTQTDNPTKNTTFFGRDGLAAYTVDPDSFPASRVVYSNAKFVVINDLYPKASVHLLILPRDARKNIMRPQDAFDDPDFLADCRAEEVQVRALVATELRRRFGSQSASDRPRIEALQSDDPPEVLPKGRDWSKEVISGIHANPSMNHLHIHVLSKDMVNECMRKTNHYLSFTTDFLVGLEHFPLAEDDYRRHYKKFPGEMLCWKCGANFGNRITALIEHLKEEKEEWIKE